MSAGRKRITALCITQPAMAKGLLQTGEDPQSRKRDDR